MRLIDADALCKYANNLKDKQIDANDIMRFPRVDAEPVRHGRWVDIGNAYECSYCCIIRRKGVTGFYHYCPNCGAKMDEEVES